MRTLLRGLSIAAALLFVTAAVVSAQTQADGGTARRTILPATKSGPVPLPKPAADGGTPRPRTYFNATKSGGGLLPLDEAPLGGDR